MAKKIRSEIETLERRIEKEKRRVRAKKGSFTVLNRLESILKGKQSGLP